MNRRTSYIDTALVNPELSKVSKNKYTLKNSEDIKVLADMIISCNFRTMYVDKIQEFTRYNGEIEVLYFVVLRNVVALTKAYVNIVCDSKTLIELHSLLEGEDLATNFKVVNNELQVIRKVRKVQSALDNYTNLSSGYEIVRVDIEGGLWYVMFTLLGKGSKFVNVGSDGQYIFTSLTKLEMYDKSSYIGYTYKQDGKDIHVPIVNYVTDWIISDSVVLAVPQHFCDSIEFLANEELLGEIEIDFNTHNLYVINFQKYSLCDMCLDDFLDIFSHSYFIRDYETVNVLRYKLLGIKLCSSVYESYKIGQRVSKDLTAVPSQIRKVKTDKNIKVTYKHKSINVENLLDDLLSEEGLHYLNNFFKKINGAQFELKGFICSKIGEGLLADSLVDGFFECLELTENYFNYTKYNLLLQNVEMALAIFNLRAHRTKLLNMILELGFNTTKSTVVISGTETEASLKIELTGFN